MDKPTGCATRFRSAVNWPESILHGSPVFHKVELFLIICQEQVSALNEPVEPLQENVHLVAHPVGSPALSVKNTGWLLSFNETFIAIEASRFYTGSVQMKRN